MGKDLKLKNVVADVDTSCISVKVIDLDTVTDYKPNSMWKIVLGSDGYIAPEAYEGRYSPASDIYSVGVILYRLLTKKFPHGLHLFDDKPGENYVGSDSMKRIRQRLQSEPIDFNQAPLNQMPDAADLLRKMLTFSPQARLTSEQALKHRWFGKSMPAKFHHSMMKASPL